MRVVHSGSHLSLAFNSGAPGAEPRGVGRRRAVGLPSGIWALLTGVPLLPAAYLVQAVRAAGKCDEVFKGFSNCLLKLGESVANYPQGLDDKTNIKTMCT